MKRKIFSLVVAFLCIVSTFGLAITQKTSNVSAVNSGTGSNELSASKVAEGTETEGEYDIKFSLPSSEGEVDTNADVVIVMDKSSLADLPGLKEATNNFVDALLEKEKDGVNFKVGVVWFNFDVHDGTTGLVDLDSTSATTIKNRIEDGGGAGSNVEAGLNRADKWLAADTAVQNRNKFVILASDLSGYAIDNGTGLGLVRYSNGQDYVGNAGLQLKYGYGSELAGITSTDIDNLIKNKTLLNGATADPGAFDKTNENGWLQYTGGPVGNSSLSSADWHKQGFATAYEQSIYYCGNELLAMNEKGYNVIAITQPYKRGVNFETVNTAFQDWFEENIGLRFDSKMVDANEALKQISSEVFDLLGKGKITDKINTAQFTLSSTDSIRVKIDNVEAKKTVITKGVKFGFGDPVNGVYPYVGTYDKATGTITWDINAKASRYALVEFIHTEKYTKEITKQAVTVPTNDGEATIEYMNSLDSENGETTFNKSFTLESPTVTIGGADSPEANKNKVTINYQYVDGSEAAPMYQSKYSENDPYSIKSPVIKGYKADISVVSGTMGTEDVTYTVTYKKIGAVVDTNNGSNTTTEATKADTGIKTGDDTNIAGLTSMFLLALAGALVLKKKMN